MADVDATPPRLEAAVPTGRERALPGGHGVSQSRAGPRGALPYQAFASMGSRLWLRLVERPGAAALAIPFLWATRQGA